MGVASLNFMIYSNKWIYAKTAFHYPVYPVGSMDSDNTKWLSMLQRCIMTLNQGHICNVKRFGRWTGQQHLLSDNGHVSTPYCNYIVSVQICNQSPNYKPLFSMLATFTAQQMNEALRIKCICFSLFDSQRCFNYSHFRLLFCKRWMNFDETWQEAFSMSSTMFVCFFSDLFFVPFHQQIWPPGKSDIHTHCEYMCNMQATRRVPYSNPSVCLSVCPSVCPLANFNIVYNFFIIRDRAFIFGMSVPNDKTFPMIS